MSGKRPTSSKKVAAKATSKAKQPKVASRDGASSAGAPEAASVAVVPTEREVRVTAAKGRPMLTWVGKRPLRQIPAYPAQQIEKFAVPGAEEALDAAVWSGWPDAYPHGGLLFHGDNKEVLAHLLANGFRGKVNLVYIDPPFDSGADYVRKVTLRGPKGTAKLDGEGYTLGEQIQYTDIWANDNYLQFMYERLLLLKELLAADGSLYLHCDWNRSHLLRCLLEEVFGPESVRNELVWKRTSAKQDSRTYAHVHDTILFVTQGDGFTWNDQYVPYDDDYVGRAFTMVEEGTGRRFKGADLTARGLRNGSSGRPWRGFDPARYGNHWVTTVERLDDLDSQGKIYWPKEGGWPRLKNYLDESKGVPLQSIWTDVFVVNSQAGERTGYPTQKPEALLERIVRASTNPNDIVLDCFLGSGTTAAVAQRLGRRWVGADINKGAIQTTAKRLQEVIREQHRAPDELGMDGGRPVPAQLSFTTWRVNDYDLQVQHNEVINLAAEFLGVQRTRTDPFFDGTLGKTLVKIIPFGRPLTPLDLEELKGELATRESEDREVTIVCLGMELGAKRWVDDWNALRKGAGAVNRFRVIELRTDPKYGGFLRHEPASARVRVRRSSGKLMVEIVDFISPTILERLRQQSGILSPRIDDWRAMVDCVMIDPAYDGSVFNVALSDVPERKQDLVQGTYELAAPAGSTTVAVKIVDMLGEEVLSVVEC